MVIHPMAANTLHSKPQINVKVVVVLDGKPGDPELAFILLGLLLPELNVEIFQFRLQRQFSADSKSYSHINLKSQVARVDFNIASLQRNNSQKVVAVVQKVEQLVELNLKGHKETQTASS